MKRNKHLRHLIFASCLAAGILSSASILWAQHQNDAPRTLLTDRSINDIYGDLRGGPFPLGTEPSLTHTVEIYWTTLNGMETKVEVSAPGERPIQSEEKVLEGQMGLTTLQPIASECNLNSFITAPTVGQKRKEGHGTITIRVYGHRREDFSTPPTVKVSSLKKGKVKAGLKRFL